MNATAVGRQSMVERPKTDNSARNFFLLLVSAFGVNIALLLFDLPEELRNICIAWLVIGVPGCFVILRIWAGYVKMQIAAMEHMPVKPAYAVQAGSWAQTAKPPKESQAPSGVGEGWLRVATGQDIDDSAKPKARTTL